MNRRLTIINKAQPVPDYYEKRRLLGELVGISLLIFASSSLLFAVVFTAGRHLILRPAGSFGVPVSIVYTGLFISAVIMIFKWLRSKSKGETKYTNALWIEGTLIFMVFFTASFGIWAHVLNIALDASSPDTRKLKIQGLRRTSRGRVFVRAQDWRSPNGAVEFNSKTEHGELKVGDAIEITTKDGFFNREWIAAVKIK